MTERDFCYWLRGYFELAEMVRSADTEGVTRSLSLTPEQLLCVRKHLDLVFENVTEGEVPFPKFERDEASIAHVVSRRC